MDSLRGERLHVLRRLRGERARPKVNRYGAE